MDKKLYDYCHKLVDKYRGAGNISMPVKTDKSLIWQLHLQYQFGQVNGKTLSFTQTDRQALIRAVKQDTALHLLHDEYPQPQSLTVNAQSYRNPKHNSQAVTQGFILVNALDDLRLNNQRYPVNSITALGQYLKADEIISIQHEYIILVENLEVMASLNRLNLPDKLREALFIYRGDKKNQQRTDVAYQFFRRVNTKHTLICFSDFDPKGMEIALSCGANYWLVPKDYECVNMAFQGAEELWFKQVNARKYIERCIAADSEEHPSLTSACKLAYNTMRKNQKTLQQEHIIVKNLPLTLIKL